MSLLILFYKFNASLLNKCNLFKTSPKLLKSSVRIHFVFFVCTFYKGKKICVAINCTFFHFDRAYHLLGKRIVAVKVRTIHMSLWFRASSSGTESDHSNVMLTYRNSLVFLSTLNKTCTYFVDYILAELFGSHRKTMKTHIKTQHMIL